MAISLDSIQTQHNRKAPRILIHGAPKVGKSSFGGSAPNPLFIATEDGLGYSDLLNSVRAIKPKNWPEILESLYLVINNPTICSTLVIDSIDHAERRCQEYVAHINGKTSIEEIPYGKGWIQVADEFATKYNVAIKHIHRELFINVIEISHSIAVTDNSPDLTTQFKRMVPDLNKHVMPIFSEDCDAILYAAHPVMVSTTDAGFGNKVTKAMGVGERRVYCQPGGGYLAGSRMALPEYVPLAFAEVAKYIPNVAGLQQTAA